MSPPRPTSTVVIGVGSPLMGDDGVGVVALEALRDGGGFEPWVELIDGGTWGMNLLPFLEGADRVLLLDAIDRGAAPGTIVELEDDAIPRYLGGPISPHQIDLREVVALAELRGTLPDELVVLGIQPERVELSAELSPTVARALPGLIERAVARLAGWGHERREGVSRPSIPEPVDGAPSPWAG